MGRPASGEQQIAALREEIGRAGRRTGLIRTLLIALPTAGIGAGFWLVYFAICRVFNLEASHPDPWWIIARDTAHEAGRAAAIGLLASVPVGCAIAALYRRWRRGRVSVVLAALMPQQRAKVLLPLQASTNVDTRRIAASLTREFGASCEVTPAPALVPRGDEPSPAEIAP
jgi:hypothetical protein